MIKTVFYVEDFPDLVTATQVTITIPRNAGPRFAVEIDLPVEALSQNVPTTPMVQAFSASPIARQSLSPSDGFYSPPERLTPSASRSLLGIDGSVDARQVTPSRSPLSYSPPRSYGSPELRQPTLFEAMQSPNLSPSYPSSLASPEYSNSANGSLYLPSPQIRPGPQPDYRGDSMYASSPCLSPYVGGQSNRPSAEELDGMRSYSPPSY